MIGKNTRLLVLAPHVDDELNCAGLISRVTAAGGHALIVACSPCYQSVPAAMAGKDIVAEFKRSCGVLRAEHMLLDVPVRDFPDFRSDIRETFWGVKRDQDVSIVCCPSPSDVHQDHEVVFQEAFRVFRNAPWLLAWESPNNQRTATHSVFVKLTEAHLSDKRAAWECYKTQHHRTHYEWGYWHALAMLRGHQCRCEPMLAEAYQHMVAVL